MAACRACPVGSGRIAGRDRRRRLALTRHSAGAFWDALWLRSSRWYALRFIHIRTPEDRFGAASFPEFTAYRTRATAFSDVMAYPYSITSVGLKAGERAQQVIATADRRHDHPVERSARDYLFGAAVGGRMSVRRKAGRLTSKR